MTRAERILFVIAAIAAIGLVGVYIERAVGSVASPWLKAAVIAGAMAVCAASLVVLVAATVAP
jgi:hypothetical protein